MNPSYNKPPPATSISRGVFVSPNWGRYRGGNRGCRLGDELAAHGQRRGPRAAGDAQLGEDVAVLVVDFSLQRGLHVNLRQHAKTLYLERVRGSLDGLPVRQVQCGRRARVL